MERGPSRPHEFNERMKSRRQVGLRPPISQIDRIRPNRRLAATRAITRSDPPACVAAPRSDRGFRLAGFATMTPAPRSWAMDRNPRYILYYKGIYRQESDF